MAGTDIKKILVLDGISGVPLGREICEALNTLGISAVRFDCLHQAKRMFYSIRSAFAKIKNKKSRCDGFYFLPLLVEKKLEAFVARERPSHILVIGFAYKFYDLTHLRKIADQFDARLFLYDTDSCNLYSKRREFIFFIENELPIYDRIFSFSQVTTRFFCETRHLDAVHLPFAAQAIKSLHSSDGEIDVLFVGSCDLRRIVMLEEIKAHVSIRGSRWQRNFPLISRELQSRVIDKPVWGADLHELLSRSKIVINITRTDFFGVETGINLRLFEALAAGCFLLTDYCEEINALFDVGKEIEVFGSRSELGQKVRYYLEHEDERLAIAGRGHDKFLESHTWCNRVGQMASQMRIST